MGFIKLLFSKRSLLGAFLLLILIGESTVGAATGLFTPGGIFIFLFLYLAIFHLFDALICKYNLNVFQVILLSFAIYSVLITGFLNKELTEYVLKPNPFITLIRIQASFFIVFAFILLSRIAPRKSTLSIKQALIFFATFVLIISTTGWGLNNLIFTLKTVPLVSLLFIFLAILALFLAFKTHSNPVRYKDKRIYYLIYLYLLLGIIPSLLTFVCLVILMILGGIYLLLNKDLRNSTL